MATDRAAPLPAASSAACWTRACSWPNAGFGSASGGCGGVAAFSISVADCGGAEVGGAEIPRTGAVTGRLYTFAWTSPSEPAATTNVTAAVAVNNVSGRTRIRLLRRDSDTKHRAASRHLHRPSRNGAGSAF